MLSVIYYVGLVMVSIAAHAFLFSLLLPSKDIINEKANQTIQTNTQVVTIIQKRPNPKPKAKPKPKASEPKKMAKDTPDKYRIGILEKTRADILEGSLGTKMQKGLPDLLFDYRAGWVKVTQHYYQEVDIIFHPSSPDLVVLQWPNGKPTIRHFKNTDAKDFINKRPWLFADKVKNRKDEFMIFEPLRSVLHRVKDAYFPSLSANDLFFAGIMPKMEISDIVSMIKQMKTNDKAVSELKVVYMKNGSGVRIALEPVE